MKNFSCIVLTAAVVYAAVAFSVWMLLFFLPIVVYWTIELFIRTKTKAETSPIASYKKVIWFEKKLKNKELSKNFDVEKVKKALSLLEDSDLRSLHLGIPFRKKDFDNPETLSRYDNLLSLIINEMFQREPY